MSSRTTAGDVTGERSSVGSAAGQPRSSDGPEPRRGLFEASAPFTLFDYFRVPYELQAGGNQPFPDGVECLRLPGDTRFVAWPSAELLRADRRLPVSYFLGSTPLFGRLCHDAEAESWRRRADGAWHAAHELRDRRGTLAGAIWEREDGSLMLPFDPNALIESFWTERYLEYVRPAAVSRLAAVARRGYYRVRPVLPRGVQMGMRRMFSRFQSKAEFPRWPVETALHELYDFLLELLAVFAARPIPYLGAWPRDWTWALVLTHDVEGRLGYDRLSELLDVELEYGYRSSWNFVPRSRYAVGEDVLRSLRERGFEVGLHGLHHDGRDISLATARERLPLMRRHGEEWDARGFRSPGTLRSVDIIQRLGFDYDSSYSDTAPFEPQPGGCCSWLPYMLGDVVELPITLVQDHTLFDLLGYDDATVWLEKARFLRQRGGMALFLTHPDYVVNGRLLDAYRAVLAEFAGDATAWKPLPRDVSDWWRRRAQSTLRADDGEWRVVGPAEGDARVEFIAPHAHTF